MALFRFLVVCSVLIYISCSVIKDDSIKETDNFEDLVTGIDIDTDMKSDEPGWNIKKACFESKIFNARSNKIICLICTGFDPSCLESDADSTSTASSPTTPNESITSKAPAGE